MSPFRYLLIGLGVLMLLAPGQAQPVAAAGGCVQLVVDGSFEFGDAWILGRTSLVPEYAAGQGLTGGTALALGAWRGVNLQSFSSARQTLTLPADAEQAFLTAWVYAMTSGDASTDYMELVLLSPEGRILEKPWVSRDDDRVWKRLSFDLTRWRGQTIQVYFNVYNDGAGGTAALLLDDVSIEACSGNAGSSETGNNILLLPTATVRPSATASPRLLPSPTPTALAEACTDIANNGGFEQEWDGWLPSPNILPAELVKSPNPVRSGATALRLGSQTENAYSYSSVRQPLVIPPASMVALEFWAYTWADSTVGSDRQEVAFLGEDETIRAKPLTSLTNDREWQFFSYDLTDLAGQELYLYFNVYNDGLGGRAALFVDDVRVIVCEGVAPLPFPQHQTATRPATSVPTRSFPTPVTMRPPTRLPTATAIVIPPPRPSEALPTVRPSPTAYGGAVTRIVLPSSTPRPRPTQTPTLSSLAAAAASESEATATVTSSASFDHTLAPTSERPATEVTVTVGDATALPGTPSATLTPRATRDTPTTLGTPGVGDATAQPHSQSAAGAATGAISAAPEGAPDTTNPSDTAQFARVATEGNGFQRLLGSIRTRVPTAGIVASLVALTGLLVLVAVYFIRKPSAK